MSNFVIDYELVKQSRINEFQLSSVEFGQEPTDHMFIAEYENGSWQNCRIQPFHPLMLSPFNLSLHYGQTVFEGMKAYRTENGNISIFRVQKHSERFNQSLRRMLMPEVPLELFREALHAFLTVDQAWVPDEPDSSLYIRPFMIANENRIKVKIGEKFLFMIVASPAKNYYNKTLNVKVETHYSRAAQGGTGKAKCGGNYGAAFYPTFLANQQGFDQLIWTDPVAHQYIEESGTMNLFFVINNQLFTPQLTDSILEGITRDSIITLAKNQNIPVFEKRISVHEIQEALENKTMQEAFGSGTAAIVAPIGTIAIHDKTYTLPAYSPSSWMFQFKQTLNDIRTGKQPDIFHWNDIINVRDFAK